MAIETTVIPTSTAPDGTTLDLNGTGKLEIMTGGVGATQILDGSITELEIASGIPVLVASVTVAGAAVASISFINLDLNAAGCYLIRCSIKAAAANVLHMQFNGDAVAGNYYATELTGNGAAAVSGRYNDSRIGYGANGQGNDCKIFLQQIAGQYPRAVNNHSIGVGNTLTSCQMTHQRQNNANVVRIDIVATGGNNIEIGSQISIYKMR